MKIRKLLALPLIPIYRNVGFFVFMYILGAVCALSTLPDTRGATLYENLWLELFVDDYAACLVLSLLPRRLRGIGRALAYTVLYATALADVYCFGKFGSTLNPSMLMLVGETDSREAGEFLRSYLTPEVLRGPVGNVVCVLALHVAWSLRRRIFRKLSYRRRMLALGRIQRLRARMAAVEPVAGIIVAAVVVWAAVASAGNKAGCHRLMSASSVGEVEHLLTAKDHGVMYMPIYRLAFSIRSNQLAARQIEQLIGASTKARVDSCSYTSPHIVLIIGESFGRHHSSQYGYAVKTTPRQSALERSGLLTKYTDVVSPWNLTSFCFKNIFSMHVIGQEGDWCDYPLFPELFRQAGYHVTFITNQFLPRAKEAVYDFSGGFFLNNPILSSRMFDSRNATVHRYDDGLLDDYRQLKDQEGTRSLTIFHLLGQHVAYKQRYPAARKKIWVSTYDTLRPELDLRERRMLADYDNATLYNDSIVDRIVRLYKDSDAVVIYMPDHGEECYEGTRGFICRNHSAAIDYDLARYEFEIPFWIYTSPKYRRRHPELTARIRAARNRRLMTDALPHMLLHLAGISAPDYHAEYDILSDSYDEMRPRLLKATTDYDKLRPAK